MEIFFCYNAKSGFFNGLVHFVHKTISPKTYKCNLCAITYTFKQKKKWAKFVRELPFRVEFVHLDHLKEYDLGSYLDKTPCCILRNGEKLTVLITKEEIINFTCEDDLINKINKINFAKFSV